MNINLYFLPVQEVIEFVFLFFSLLAMLWFCKLKKQIFLKTLLISIIVLVISDQLFAWFETFSNQPQYLILNATGWAIHIAAVIIPTLIGMLVTAIFVYIFYKKECSPKKATVIGIVSYGIFSILAFLVASFIY